MKSLESSVFDDFNILTDKKVSDFPQNVKNITILNLDWGIFVFCKAKKDLLNYINDPKRTECIIGFHNDWYHDLPDIWKNYLKNTGKSYALCLVWLEQFEPTYDSDW